MTQTTTFRAAYLPSDGGGTLLPLPEHATLGDESLLAVATEEMARGGVETSNPADGGPKHGKPEEKSWVILRLPVL